MKCADCPLNVFCPGEAARALCLLKVVPAAARHAAAGFPGLPGGALEARMTACRACEHYNPSRNSCRLCGCWLRAKAGMPGESCPDTPPRWGPVDPAGDAGARPFVSRGEIRRPD